MNAITTPPLSAGFSIAVLRLRPKSSRHSSQLNVIKSAIAAVFMAVGLSVASAESELPLKFPSGLNDRWLKDDQAWLQNQIAQYESQLAELRRIEDKADLAKVHIAAGNGSPSDYAAIAHYQAVKGNAPKLRRELRQANNALAKVNERILYLGTTRPPQERVFTPAHPQSSTGLVSPEQHHQKKTGQQQTTQQRHHKTQKKQVHQSKVGH